MRTATARSAATIPDAKIVRIEPRTFRNVFPSLSPEQQQVARASTTSSAWPPGGRVAGHRDRRRGCSSRRTACATATSSGRTPTTGLLLKARIVERAGRGGRAVRVHRRPIGAKIDKDMVKPSWPSVPPGLAGASRVGPGDVVMNEPGWTVDKRAAGLHQDHGRLSHAARQAGAGGAPRVFRRARRGQRVRRADTVTHDADRAHAGRAASISTARAAGRHSGDRAGRSARRHRPADRATRSRAARRALHPLRLPLAPSPSKRRLPCSCVPLPLVAAIAALLAVACAAVRRACAVGAGPAPGRCPISPICTRSRARPSCRST